ncbi:hypothetical protein M514_14059 [Trichuris suis]|uniref:Uncharacterized protein n=1 Tax=Trichuris suis TaxID=68888 RepID=A0A085MQB6_9BILA|nr:hypothetical protein M513_14059 [Trichuris suis]KFD59412.1 hypothetical protein M514_14059 [Trichuris suis]
MISGEYGLPAVLSFMLCVQFRTPDGCHGNGSMLHEVEKRMFSKHMNMLRKTKAMTAEAIRRAASSQQVIMTTYKEG